MKKLRKDVLVISKSFVSTRESMRRNHAAVFVLTSCGIRLDLAL